MTGAALTMRRFVEMCSISVPATLIIGSTSVYLCVVSQCSVSVTRTHRNVEDTSSISNGLLERQTSSAAAAYMKADPNDLQAKLCSTSQQLTNRLQSGAKLETESYLGGGVVHRDAEYQSGRSDSKE